MVITEANGFRTIRKIAAAVAVAFSLTTCVFAAGPRNAARDEAKNDETTSNVFVPPDRATLNRLSQAKDLANRENFGGAVRNLGAILDGPEDFFFQPDKNRPVYRSIKAEAQRLLGEMPREAREMYELQYGARAESMLKEAAASGDSATLAEVSRRFFHTQAGRQATLLLGLDHLDHGRPLAAALTLQRLTEFPELAESFEPSLSLDLAASWRLAGSSNKAARTLLDLKSRMPNVTPIVAGKPVPWFSGLKDVQTWLDKYIGAPIERNPERSDERLVYRGNPARNSTDSGDVPLLNVCWTAPTLFNPQLEAAVDAYEQYRSEGGMPCITAVQPLAVNDVILTRNFRTLMAVDFSTGKRLWEAPTDDVPEDLTIADAFESNYNQMLYVGAIVQQRLLTDSTYGQLSSDGSLVFAVEDLGIGASFPFVARSMTGRGGAANAGQQTTYNRLAAYDVRTGKLKWQLGGKSGEYELRQPETFFLGAPLPLMGQLYAIVEVKQEIRLVALDASTGDLLWSQQLAMVERGVQQEVARRTSGCSPSYSDGVLVCPTSAGSVVAVDLAARSLLWGYRYGRDSRADRTTRMMQSQLMYMSSDGAEPEAARWGDSAAVIFNDHVLLALRESNELHCLNLLTGELAWSAPREDDIFIACALPDKVVLVGSRGIRALKWDKGKLAWKTPVNFADGVRPCGRGFYNGQEYILPLSSATAVAVDLEKGVISRTVQSRNAEKAGNLIPYKGYLLSQTSRGLTVFRQRDAAVAEVAHRLQKDPNDAQALELQGELQLDSGDLNPAVDSLRRSYAIHPDDRTREFLRGAYFEGLENNFAAFRDRAAEAESLTDSPAHKATLLRLMTVGWRLAGNRDSALEYFRKLADLDSHDFPLDKPEKNRWTRRDRWLESEFAALCGESTSGSSGSVESFVVDRLNLAKQSNSLESWERFLRRFGDADVKNGVYTALLSEYVKSKRILDAEALVRRVSTNDATALGVESLVDLTKLYRRVNSPEIAALFFDAARRAAEYASPDENAKFDAFASSLSKDDQLRNPLRDLSKWPKGVAEKNRPRSNEPRSAAANLSGALGRVAVELAGEKTFFADNTFALDVNRFRLIAFDASGRETWLVSLGGANERPPRYDGSSRTLTQLRAVGRSLYLSFSGKLYAIDASVASKATPPRILWSHELSQKARNWLDENRIRRGDVAVRGIVTFGSAPLGYSSFGVLTDQYVCFAQDQCLVAVDPYSGEVLWRRNDVPADSLLFGDRSTVFALPNNSNEAFAFRASDGESIGKRSIPSFTVRQSIYSANADLQQDDDPDAAIKPETSAVQYIAGIVDRTLILFSPKRESLTAFDPLTQKSSVLADKLDAKSQFSLSDDVIGAFQPSGQLKIVRIADQKIVADLKLNPESNLVDCRLFRNGDAYYLQTNSTSLSANARQAPITQPMPCTTYFMIFSGRLYAIGMDGKALWSSPAVIDRQNLIGNAPAASPAIVFASQRYDSRQQYYAPTTLLIDKRDGHVVGEDRRTRQSGVFQIVINEKDFTVDLVSQQETTTFKYTNKPIPPPGESEQTSGPLDGARRSLEKAFSELMTSPLPQTPAREEKGVRPPQLKLKKPAAKKPADAPNSNKPELDRE